MTPWLNPGPELEKKSPREDGPDQVNLGWGASKPSGADRVRARGNLSFLHCVYVALFFKLFERLCVLFKFLISLFSMIFIYLSVCLTYFFLSVCLSDIFQSDFLTIFCLAFYVYFYVYVSI